MMKKNYDTLTQKRSTGGAAGFVIRLIDPEDAMPSWILGLARQAMVRLCEDAHGAGRTLFVTIVAAEQLTDHDDKPALGIYNSGAQHITLAGLPRVGRRQPFGSQKEWEREFVKTIAHEFAHWLQELRGEADFEEREAEAFSEGFAKGAAEN